MSCENKWMGVVALVFALGGCGGKGSDAESGDVDGRSGASEQVPEDLDGSEASQAAGAVGDAALIERGERSLSGRAFEISFREGEAVYGTYFFEQISFCASGRYSMTGSSERTTVLGNVQRSSYSASGTWRVASMAGQLGVLLLSNDGGGNVMTFELRGGAITFQRGVSIVSERSADCD